MIQLKDKDISAVFLKHKELVHNAYNNGEKSPLYELKTALFNYESRSEKIKSKNRKRRRKSLSSSSSSSSQFHINTESMEQINKLQEFADKIISNLKEKRIYPDASLKFIDNDDFQFTNYLFHDQNFPKFKGENNTSTSILYEMNNQKYLIPPKSKFFNYDIREIGSIEPSLDKFDLIIIDPPWKNKYIRRIKKIKLEYGYEMLENDTFAEIPIKNLIKMNTLVGIWCTNSPTHQKDIIEKLLPAWNLKLFKKLYWIKLNRNGDLICKFHDPGQKQPYEILFVAVSNNFEKSEDNLILNDVDFIVSSSSVIHSHKPPLFEMFQKYLPDNPECLEVFARYLYPNFTSIGLEVLKLMDVRLYNCIETSQRNKTEIKSWT